MSQKYELPPGIEAGGLLYTFSYVAQGQIRMTVTGSGRIPGKEELQPWLRYRNQISELWIGEGVTGVGVRAFCGYGWLERLWLPRSIRELEYMAFGCCPRLAEITYAGTTVQLQQVIMDNALPEQFKWKEEKDALRY